MKKIELKDEFDYYIKHQEELVSKYNGKYIAIADGQVLGVFDDEDQAIKGALETHELGTFLIQLVGSGKENYTTVFHSRVRA